MIDKGRATLSKKNGEYIYNSPTDKHLVRFLGFDADALLKELAAGKGDGEILQWVLANAKTPRALWEPASARRWPNRAGFVRGWPDGVPELQPLPRHKMGHRRLR
jgi:hypothetical protein